MYYLNQRGTKWVVYPKEDYFIEDYTTKEIIVRKAIRFEAFGNSAVIVYSYKGKIKSSTNFSTKLSDI